MTVARGFLRCAALSEIALGPLGLTQNSLKGLISYKHFFGQQNFWKTRPDRFSELWRGTCLWGTA